MTHAQPAYDTIWMSIFVRLLLDVNLDVSFVKNANVVEMVVQNQNKFREI